MDHYELKTPVDNMQYHTTAIIVAMCVYAIGDQNSLESYVSKQVPAEA